ncbi:MAG: hypothetical protein RL071_1184, partial [Pseudomonadota bacterium]
MGAPSAALRAAPPPGFAGAPVRDAAWGRVPARPA